LQDVRMELIDSIKLAHLIATTLPDEPIPRNLAEAIRTTSDIDFPRTFATSIFTQPRWIPNGTRVHVQRTTCYLPFYLARFNARGSMKTGAGVFENEWEGSVGLRGDGRKVGLGEPPRCHVEVDSLVPLKKALQTVPGNTHPPELQPNQAI